MSLIYCMLYIKQRESTFLFIIFLDFIITAMLEKEFTLLWNSEVNDIFIVTYMLPFFAIIQLI